MKKLLIFGILLLILFSTAVSAIYCDFCLAKDVDCNKDKIYAIPIKSTPPIYSPPIVPPPPPPPIMTNAQFIYPEEGQVISDDYILLTGRDNLHSNSPIIETYSFEYWNGLSWQQIFNPMVNDQEVAPTTRWDFDNSYYQVFWDVSNIPSGYHQIRFTASAVGFTSSITRGVQIVKKPVPGATATDNSPNPGDTKFDASPSTDEGTIKSYDWDFNDTTKGTGRIVVHTYANRNRVYYVILTVTNTNGAQATKVYKITFDPFSMTEVPWCGCQKMHIIKGDHGETSDIPFPNPHHNPNGPNALGATSNPSQLFFNFEVKADLTPGSNAALCHSSQWVKDYITFDTNKVDSMGGGVGNPDWTQVDDYTGTEKGPGGSTIQARNATSIYWIDAPGIPYFSSYYYQPNGFNWNGKFRANVDGTDGQPSCLCYFDYVINVNVFGEVTQQPYIGNIDCS